MKFLVGILLGWLCAYCTADPPTPTPSEPYQGEWNHTNSHQELCMKLKAGIRLDIVYDTVWKNGTTKTATILSDSKVIVDDMNSKCENSTTDVNETLALQFNDQRTLTFYFTRDKLITKDDKGGRWLLYKVAFDFIYDSATFPESADIDSNGSLINTNTTLGGIATGTGRSFSCSKTGTMEITDRLKISFINLRAQAFITGNDFSTADHCAADQETTDLIPIIIGAALAALVIIVLIAYLIGRARAKNTPNYDNMK
jgi:lysosomal-associated membrane protein 1/2